ncbi:MAG: hypothetical protein KAR19_12610 [Bacteroidales bacterium]|nr:hypothetical protein [Bacteroidales bacterium]
MVKKQTTKKKPSLGYIEYTLKQKMQVLEILQENDLSYYKTGKQIKISHTTIRRWHTQYGDEMNKASIAKEMAEEVTDDMAKRNKDFFDAVFKVKVLTINRMLELVKDERNLDNLQKTLKTLCEIDGSSKKNGEEEPKGTVINIYEQINNQLIQQGYEPENPHKSTLNSD